MVSKIFHSSRDDVVGTVSVQGKEIGFVKSVSPTMDNDPQELATIDTRTIFKYMGAHKLSMKLDKNHYIMIEPNLYELALGHKAVDADGNVMVGFDDEMTSKWTTAQYSSDAIEKVYDDGVAIVKQDLAQSFIARGTSIISQKFFCGKEGTFSDSVYLNLYPDDGTGKPDTTTSLANGSFYDIGIDTWGVSEYKWRVPGGLITYHSLVIGATYWIILTEKATSGSSDNYFGLKYLSTSDSFPDGKLMTYDGTSFTDENYDSAFELLFETKNGVEIDIRLTNGTNKIVQKYKNCKVSAVDCSVESNALIFDSGTIEVENVEVEESPI